QLTSEHKQTIRHQTTLFGPIGGQYDRQTVITRFAWRIPRWPISRVHWACALLCSLLWLVGSGGAFAQEARFALVIGNDHYRAATLATPANDAGLVADALGAAGFAVTGARNLDQAALRESFREFVGQVAAAGPNAVAVVYLAGFGLQFEGEN